MRGEARPMDNVRRKTDDVSTAFLVRVTPRSPSKGPDEFPHEEFLGMTAVVASASMRQLLQITRRVSRMNSPVLITGESGSGKELIARAVHQFSPRAARPFIDVNCAALPEHLIESEIFGYERGAFSGAESMKPGLFEAAHGGTLFLDEIAELDFSMQGKLLRVLDGQPYFRLGGSRKVACDVRVVAATNLDLAEGVKSGHFRSDLFHRLDGFNLRVPPLRERVDDIVPLANWFLRDTGLRLSARSQTALEEYGWPGNIRELRNAMNKATIIADGPEITLEDLPREILRNPAACRNGHLLEGMEEQAIRRALEQTGEHQQKAADLLGISRRTLIRKLKSYRSHGNP